MSTAYSGKILHIDLSDRRTWVEEVSDLLYRRYLGGSALGAHFLLRDLRPGIDPLGPDNLLVITTSVINGLPISGANRYNVAAKSPLTYGIGDSQAGGYWGPELKRTGYDGIIVHGRSERPVYVYVTNDGCEIRDASKYWGRLSDEVQDGITEELGDSHVCVLQTGISGEKAVRFASIVNQLRHFHGRCGLGAVMGSKNLKAIAVRGHLALKPVDPTAAAEVLKWFQDNYNRDEDLLHLYGTSASIPFLDENGMLPTRNFREGSFEHASDISGQTMSKTILHDSATCFACAVGCKREVEVKQRGVVPRFGGMEYETIVAFGSDCGIGDLGAIAEASQWVNRYVLDSISTGMVVAFAMECFEKGILTKEDTGGIDLTWGNADGAIQLIHKIARREGIGDLLAEGVLRASKKLGRGSEEFALHVKGQELALHEPRVKRGVALQYTASPTGADHVECTHDNDFEVYGNGPHRLSPLGLIESVDRLDIGPRKVNVFIKVQKVWSLYNCVGMCIFAGAPSGALSLEQLVKYVNAATGWDMSLYEMMMVAERNKAMARLFNIREGFTAEDDMLPRRMFNPIENGKMKGTKLERRQLKEALRLYYQGVGWDEKGVPTPGKLAELGLTWILEGVGTSPET